MSKITLDWVEQNLPEYTCVVEVPGKGICGLGVMITTTGLFINLDKEGYQGRYCYHTFQEAMNALMSWSGNTEHPPGNWIKYKSLNGSIINPNYKSDDDD